MGNNDIDRRYSSQAWKLTRAEVMARDAGRCQLRGDACTGTATEVDHIVSPKLGGAFYDLANLRAACRECNASRGARSRARAGWRLAPTHIEVLLVTDTTKERHVDQALDVLRGGPHQQLLDLDEGGRGSAARSSRHRRGGHGPAGVIDGRGLIHATGSTSLGRLTHRLLLDGLRRGELGLGRVVVVVRPGEDIPPHHELLILDSSGNITRQGGEGGTKPSSSRDWTSSN